MTITCVYSGKEWCSSRESKGKYNFLKYMHSAKGVYGFGRVMKICMTIGTNPKAGMDTIEFENCLNATILPLYPDIYDMGGAIG